MQLHRLKAGPAYIAISVLKRIGVQLGPEAAFCLQSSMPCYFVFATLSSSVSKLLFSNDLLLVSVP